MFTGLIATQGRLLGLQRQGAGGRIRIGLGAGMASAGTTSGGTPPGGAALALPPGLARPATGASIAVNGVCLTMVAFSLDPWIMEADVMPETLAVSALGSLRPGDSVNLEAALRLGDPLDGHLVYGDIDGTGTIRGVEERANARIVRIAPRDPGLLRWIVLRGRIAVDGASLTVMERSPEHFAVSLIPHTQTMIRLGSQYTGSLVNLETDLLARHLVQAQEHKP